jgi:hypothetical protein
MYFMGMFHYVQLSAGVRSSVLSLKSLPNVLPHLYLEIGVHRVINQNVDDGTPEQIII